MSLDKITTNASLVNNLEAMKLEQHNNLLEAVLHHHMFLWETMSTKVVNNPSILVEAVPANTSTLRGILKWSHKLNNNSRRYNIFSNQSRKRSSMCNNHLNNRSSMFKHNQFRKYNKFNNNPLLNHKCTILTSLELLKTSILSLNLETTAWVSITSYQENQVFSENFEIL